MFTFKPATKNGSNGNGHDGSRDSANGNGGSNGHANGNGNSNGNSNGNGNGNGGSRALVAGWLGLSNGHARANGNGHAHANGNGHSTRIESVIGPGIHLQGNLTGLGGIRIEGTFDGRINVKGSVVIADGAKVTADIQAASVVVAGALQGNITAQKVEIRSTGRIFGDLVTTAFATEEGAFLRGQVRMEEELPASAPAQLAAPTAAQPETAALVLEHSTEPAA